MICNNQKRGYDVNKLCPKTGDTQKRKERFIKKIADKDGLSFSELVRKYLNSQLRLHTYKEMAMAADALLADYSTNSDLTDMTALNGDDVIHG